MSSAPCLFIKSKGSLIPADEEAESALACIAEGGRVLANMRAPRSEKMNRFFFAVLKKVQENSDHWPSVESLRKALLIRAGHCDEIVTLNGEILLQARSMAGLDQIRFKRLLDRCMHIICTEIIPGLDNQALETEVMDMLGGDKRG